MKNLAKFILLTVTVTLLLPLLASAQVSGTAPQTFWRETDKTLPLGLWRVQVDGDQFSIQKNTDATGAFGTTTTIMSVTGSNVTFPSGWVGVLGGAQSPLSLYGVINATSSIGSDFSSNGSGGGYFQHFTDGFTYNYAFGTNPTTGDFAWWSGRFASTAGTERLRLTQAGQLVGSDGSTSAPGFGFISETNTGLYRTAGVLNFTVQGTTSVQMTNSQLSLASATLLGWNGDTYIVRDAANIPAIKNGTTAQELRVYGTTTGPKYASFKHNGTDIVISSAGGDNLKIALDSGQWFGPTVDNGIDLATASSRFRSGFFGTSISMGTTPAATGLIRVPNNSDFLYAKNGAGTDVILMSITSGNLIKLNGGSADLDLSISSVSNANHFISDAGAFSGVGATGFGRLVSGSSAYVVIGRPTISQAASTDYFDLNIIPSGAVTIPSGTAALVGSVNIEEPNITATGTVSDAYTLRIGGAPTEGTRNGALWVVSGNVRIDSQISLATDASVPTVGKIRLPTPATTVASIATPLSQQFFGATKALTDNTATDLFVIDNDTDGEMSGGIIEYTITADSGSQIQVETGTASFAEYNNGGTQAGSITAFDAQQQLSTGTLTVTFTRANDAIGNMIRVTADTSLNVALTITYRILNNSARAITLQ